MKYSANGVEIIGFIGPGKLDLGITGAKGIQGTAKVRSDRFFTENKNRAPMMPDKVFNQNPVDLFFNP